MPNTHTLSWEILSQAGLWLASRRVTGYIPQNSVIYYMKMDRAIWPRICSCNSFSHFFWGELTDFIKRASEKHRPPPPTPTDPKLAGRVGISFSRAPSIFLIWKCHPPWVASEVWPPGSGPDSGLPGLVGESGSLLLFSSILLGWLPHSLCPNILGPPSAPGPALSRWPAPATGRRTKGMQSASSPPSGQNRPSALSQLPLLSLQRKKGPSRLPRQSTALRLTSLLDPNHFLLLHLLSSVYKSTRIRLFF